MKKCPSGAFEYCTADCEWRIKDHCAVRHIAYALMNKQECKCAGQTAPKVKVKVKKEAPK